MRIVITKNKKQAILRKLNPGDLDLLHVYLQKLSAETKKRFGPHKYDKESIIDFYKNSDTLLAYVGIDMETKEIIAYFLIKTGYLEHDHKRFESYGIELDNMTGCTFAPSVADDWQSCGIGEQLFHYILSDLKTKGIQRIVLWGGVQMDNEKALNYYKKNHFKTAGQFTHNGENYDMMLDLDPSIAY